MLKTKRPDRLRLTAGNTGKAMGVEDSTLQHYMQEITQIPVLTRGEEMTLIPAAQAGDRSAFDTVIRSNLRYVVSIANEYKDRGIPMMDIIGEGNLGLFRALKTFDPSRGIKFITYAKWWIKQCIVYSIIYKSHLVRIPQSQLRKLRKLKNIDESTVSMDDFEAAFDNSYSGENPDEDPIWSLSKCLIHKQSLDQAVTDDNKTKLIDFIPNQDSNAPDSELHENSLNEDLKDAFSILKEREIDVLKMLFGFKGVKATLGDVAVKYGISRERVRQIKNNALDKLRDSKEVREVLINYVD